MEVESARILAENEMKKHGLIEKEWTIDFDNAKRRFGCCDHRIQHISLSRQLVELNDIETVKDIILHEIAHALLGYGHGHNQTFYNKCIELGCKPERCYGKDVKLPKSKYLISCSNNCFVNVEKNRKCKGAICVKCGAKVKYKANV